MAVKQQASRSQTWAEVTGTHGEGTVPFEEQPGPRVSVPMCTSPVSTRNI